jgi:hypothetical protein
LPSVTPWGTRQRRHQRYRRRDGHFSLPSAREMALGKEPFANEMPPRALCRALPSAKALPWAKLSLPNAWNLSLVVIGVCRVPKVSNTRQIRNAQQLNHLPSAGVRHTTNILFAECHWLTLGKAPALSMPLALR